MTNKVVHWSRRPCEFLEAHTGKSFMAPVESMTVGEWYHTLNEIIRLHVQPSETQICTSRDMQTILENLVNYRPYLPDIDPVRADVIGTSGPMQFVGTLVGEGSVMREIFIVKGESPDLVISGPDSTTTIQIHGFPDFF